MSIQSKRAGSGFKGYSRSIFIGFLSGSGDRPGSPSEVRRPTQPTRPPTRRISVGGVTAFVIGPMNPIKVGKERTAQIRFVVVVVIGYRVPKAPALPGRSITITTTTTMKKSIKSKRLRAGLDNDFAGPAFCEKWVWFRRVTECHAYHWKGESVDCTQ